MELLPLLEIRELGNVLCLSTQKPFNQRYDWTRNLSINIIYRAVYKAWFTLESMLRYARDARYVKSRGFQLLLYQRGCLYRLLSYASHSSYVACMAYMVAGTAIFSTRFPHACTLSTLVSTLFPHGQVYTVQFVACLGKGNLVSHSITHSHALAHMNSLSLSLTLTP